MNVQRLITSIKLLKCGIQVSRCLNTESSTCPSKLLSGFNALMINPTPKNNDNSCLQLSPRSIMNITTEIGRIKPAIMDIPLLPIPQSIPINTRISILDMPLDERVMECPTIENQEEKQAVRMIVIRRRKMRKHKLKKLRKRMKFEWAKRRQRRELRKEKAFQAVLITQIKDAEKFSAEAYVTDMLRQANETPIPRFWKGKRLPQFLIRQLMGLDKKVNYKPF